MAPPTRLESSPLPLGETLSLLQFSLFWARKKYASIGKTDEAKIKAKKTVTRQM
ncbi:hypothetical protein FH972_016066 [Carpinus fangiana]|uniref:Uncharacterized protein n=1 Tax=Carpinus fangiana TaxID=176857 RepID=A0A5N6RI49_9ROSI|nr:hypothetical protein FH972_016066 [Carpinus fangiana]